MKGNVMLPMGASIGWGQNVEDYLSPRPGN
jgi:hypothetical protein